MKVLLVILALAPLLTVAEPSQIYSDSEGVVHYQEVFETPEAVKNEISRAWKHGLEMANHSPLADIDLSKELDGVGVIIDKIVNLGKKVWAVVENGRPVVNVNSLFANALPAGARSSELENFSEFQFQSIRHQGVNLYGATVYDVIYTLVHRYGGTYQGRGAYLEGVSVLPQRVEVMWGYNLDLKVEQVSAVNIGDRENPVASLALQTSLNVKTVLQELRLKNIHEFVGNRAEVNSTELR